MNLTLIIKVYNHKKLLDVNLHGMRKNTNPIWQKTDVHFSRYLTPNMAMSNFFQNILDNVPLGYRGFYHHFLFNF